MDAKYIDAQLHMLLPDYSGDVIYFDETDSTNLRARSYASTGKEALLIAGRQTNGMGRFDRTFISEKGGLFFSFVLKTTKQPIEVMDYPVKVGECVSKSILNLYNLQSDIKWPNDVLVNGKKICGILLESIPHDDYLYIIFGIGVNVENPIPPSLPDAQNLKNILKTDIKKEDLLMEILKNLIALF